MLGAGYMAKGEPFTYFVLSFSSKDRPVNKPERFFAAYGQSFAKICAQ